MKKILPLILILLLSAQFCRAQDSAAQKLNSIQPAQAAPTNTAGQADEEEDINKYFVEEETQNVPASTSTTTTQTITNTNNQTVDQYSGANSNQSIGQSTDQSTDQSIELNGYVQYNSEPEEATAIHLEPVETKTINFSQPKKVDSSTPEGFRKPTFHPMETNALESASKFSTQEYDISPVSTSYDRKLGRFTFGTMYNSSLSSSAGNSYSTGLFSKYEGKHFALSAIYSKSTNSNYDSYNDKFSFAPELKLTKRLSLLDVMQTDVYRINTSNELVLRYTPHMKKYADDVQFELGAGQSYYDANYINSSIRFSTRFKL